MADHEIEIYQARRHGGLSLQLVRLIPIWSWWLYCVLMLDWPVPSTITIRLGVGWVEDHHTHPGPPGAPGWWNCQYYLGGQGLGQGQGPGIYCDSDKIGNISWPSVNTTPALISNMIMGCEINMFVSSNRDYLVSPRPTHRSPNIKNSKLFWNEI